MTGSPAHAARQKAVAKIAIQEAMAISQNSVKKEQAAQRRKVFWFFSRGPKRKQASMFFFEKKNQKTFACYPWMPDRSRITDKSFSVLFFKKEHACFTGFDPRPLLLRRSRHSIGSVPSANPGPFAPTMVVVVGMKGIVGVSQQNRTKTFGAHS